MASTHEISHDQTKADKEEIKCDTSDKEPITKEINQTQDEETKSDSKIHTSDSTPTDHKTETEGEKTKENGDSESESEEEREKEIEERKKLHQQTQEHKQKMLKIIYVLIAIEIVICSILISPSTEIKDIDNYLSSRIANFRYDTMDVITVSILRIICLYGFTSFAITWGNVKTYDLEKDKHTIFNTKTSHYKLITTIKGTMASIVLEIWSRIIGLNHENNSSVNNDGLNSLLLHQKQNDNDSITDDPISDEKKKIKRIFDLKEFVEKYNGMDAKDVADVWKSFIWIMLFFVITIFETYIGIKISFFINDSNYYYYITLFVLIISLIHFQTYFIKKYIDDECEPNNRYQDLRIHPHPIFKIKNKGTIYGWCQICSTAPDRKTKKGKFVFKCNQCPRHRAHVCVKCWGKKRKEFKLKEEKRNDEEIEINDEDKDVTFKEYFITLLEYHIPYIYLLACGVITMGIGSLINVFVPRQNGHLLDKMISGDFDGFYFVIKVQIFLKVSSSLISTFSRSVMNRVSQHITCDLQKQMFSSIMSQDMVFFDKNTENDITRRMNWGLSEMLNPFQSTIRVVLSSGISVIGSLYMCLTISWRLTFLGLSTLGPMSYLMSLFNESRHERWYLQHQLSYEMSRLSSHGIRNIRTVRAFVKEHELVKYYNMLRQESFDAENRNKMIQDANQIVNGWFSLGTKLLLTWIAGIIILNNQSNTQNYSTNLTVGLFVTFQTYWYQLYETLRQITRTLASYDQAFFTAKKVFRTLAKKSNIEHVAIGGNGDDEKTKELIQDFGGDIKLEDVEFYYESSPNKLVLKSLNLHIERGKTTALVGRSGGGKSTIMHLLLRFYDPTKGRITMNGIDLRKYNPYSLRRQIALVAQDTELFYQSMEYNIGYGAHKLIKIGDKYEYESAYNMEQIEYCAKLANAHKFINEMEEKYSTKMGTRANRCSGGQKQRISIARMLMSKPSVMLLDEATSSLDAESEALVQAAMERESEEKNCTLVIVAHRLSTVVNADKICVVDDGTIVEEGTHEELIHLKGIYASLVERQINLRTKMKQKLERIKNGDEQIKDGGGKVDDDDDCDNIDKLIDQIKAEKEKKKKETQQKDNGNKEEYGIIEEDECDEIKT